MGTRCTVNFTYGGNVVAKVYRHWDGSPETMKNDLNRFFEDVQGDTRDTRFTDPEYLAAKYVVWQAGQYAGNNKRLDFLGVGVCLKDPGDIEYRHYIDCDSKEPVPVVRSERA